MPRPKRSKLNVRDTGLRPPFRYFMDQEIASSPDNLDEILRYYFHNPETDGLFAAFEDRKDLCKALVEKVLALYDGHGRSRCWRRAIRSSWRIPSTGSWWPG